MLFRTLCAVAGIVLSLVITTGHPAAAQQPAGKRVALVVGNASYRSVDRLANPANDARLIARTLAAAGFTLIGGGPQIDLDKAHFEKAVQTFGQSLPGAEAALFYYSGHGMQVQGVNWLVPVDANPTTNQDLDFQMVDANLVLRQMESAGTRLNLLILDACRNNPFAFRGMRGGQGGLAEMHAPEGTLISYATQPGNVAADGSTGNSPYTSSLASALQKPGLDVFQVFNQVGLAVKQMTGGQQQPWLASSPISGTFFFFSGPVTIMPPAAVDAEAVFWQSIANSLNPDDFRSYLRRFPHGLYVELAERRAAALSASPAAIVAPNRMAAPVQPAAPGRFDGDWLLKYACGATADGANGFQRTLWATIRNSVLHGEGGTKGQPNYLTLDGQVQPDGVALLTAAGLTGASQFSVGHVPPGSHFGFHVKAKFEQGRGSGSRIENRSCDLEFTRQ
ncbi:MAG TPA: caspase family protein [Acetobacteraceae bacterium]|nr:caspase family protein [Acetobacteraceae bacterium]